MIQNHTFSLPLTNNFESKSEYETYSGTPLVRPPLLQEKSGLSSGVDINTFV